MPVKTIVLFRSKTDDAVNEDIYEKVQSNQLEFLSISFVILVTN